MATELGKAYVQIIPSAKGISGAISSELGGSSMAAGKTAGLNIAGAIKGAIVAAGIGTAIKSALEAGGNLQQSFGGLDTLYGDAADAAKEYAVQAAQAGISANTYAEQAVSFGASLKQAFKDAGDETTQQALAAEAANTAIMDMADNAAKMGTDINSIQNAYQGFAKQNYTMLDNLKLGYGGTKTEMERLLADAEELSGVHYNIDNLGDVYSAIHVIQEDLGLTGVAAEEASSTFTGSFGAMKAAAENLMADLTLGNDIQPALNTLGKTVNAFLFNNLLPMVGNMLKAVPDLLSGLSTMVVGALNRISQNSDELVQTGIEIVTSLATAIVTAAPYLVEAAWNLAVSLGNALINTDWSTIGSNLLSSLKESIDMAAGEIFGADTVTVDSIMAGIMNGSTRFLEGAGELLRSLYDGITANLPTLLESGVAIVTEIVNGIWEGTPGLIVAAGQLITDFVVFILDNLPALLDAGVQLLLNLLDGFLSSLPDVIASVAQVCATMITTILQHLPQFLAKGIEIIGKLIAGLISAIPKLVAALPKIFTAITGAFTKYDWKQIGIDILVGIKNGILNAVSTVVDAAKQAASDIWEAVKGYFKIGSPSKLMYYAGQMVDLGFANGIRDNQNLINNAVGALTPETTATLQTNMSAAPASSDSEIEQRLDALVALLGAYLPAIADGNVQITLDGDAGRLFRLMQRESIRNTQLVGTNAVLAAT